MKLNNIKLYADGLNINEFDQDFGIEIDGYTFNPSLFKKNGAIDYIGYSKKIIKKCNSKPVSLEVIADNEKEMIDQAIILDGLASNVFVKIPITFTDKKYTLKVLEYLIKKRVKLNVTAIFTIEQILQILPIVKDSQTILSIFAGRIFDCGFNANVIIKEIVMLVKKKSTCKILWASPRMTYDYINANESGADIITMQASQIKRLQMFRKSLEDYSLETVKQFYDDAKSSGYKIA